MSKSMENTECYSSDFFYDEDDKSYDSLPASTKMHEEIDLGKKTNFMEKAEIEDTGKENCISTGITPLKDQLKSDSFSLSDFSELEAVLGSVAGEVLGKDFKKNNIDRSIGFDDDNVPEELKDLINFVEKASSTSEKLSVSQQEDESEEVKNILEKIQNLEAAQGKLECSINSDELNLSFDDCIAPNDSFKTSAHESMSEELKSVRNFLEKQETISEGIIVPTESSCHDENLKSADEVLKEYEELERRINLEGGDDFLFECTKLALSKKSEKDSKLSTKRRRATKSVEPRSIYTDVVSVPTSLNGGKEKSKLAEESSEASPIGDSKLEFNDVMNMASCSFKSVHSQAFPDPNVEYKFSKPVDIENKHSKGMEKSQGDFPANIFSNVGQDSKHIADKTTNTSPIEQKQIFMEDQNFPHPTDSIKAFQGEIFRQEAMIGAYQKDNKKLYTQLKDAREKMMKKEEEYREVVGSLKDQIASLKLNRLIELPASKMQKSLCHSSDDTVERDRDCLQEQCDVYAEENLQLKREIFVLRSKLDEKQQDSKKQNQAKTTQAQDKENEYQKQIKSLNKQIRTLQKILYHKDPEVAEEISKLQDAGKFPGMGNTNTNGRTFSSITSDQIEILEKRIIELEENLSKADDEATQKLNEFQKNLTSMKVKYEERIEEIQCKCAEARSLAVEEASNKLNLTILELNEELEKCKGETHSLKSELAKTKRELEISLKTKDGSKDKNDVSSQQSLSLALRTFKAELSVKEKEIFKLKKEISDLKKTNSQLQKEREKYLLASKERSTKKAGKSDSLQKLRKSVSGTCVDDKAAKKNAKTEPDTSAGHMNDELNGDTSMNTVTMQKLKMIIDAERKEFHNILDEMRQLLEEKNSTIGKLHEELSQFKLHDKNSNWGLVEDLKARLSSQNAVIKTLNEHIRKLSKVETEYEELKEENDVKKFEVKELSRKLDHAQKLARPENEVLNWLSGKVEELNARYAYREKQIGKLLKRCSFHKSCHTTGTSSSRTSANIIESSEFLATCSPQHGVEYEDRDLKRLSPTIASHVLGLWGPSLPYKPST